MPMHYTLLWDGSEVAWVRAEGADVLIKLSAAAVSKQEGPSSDAIAQRETGFLRPVALRLVGASGLTHASDWFGALSDGCVVTNGQAMRALPLPCRLSGGLSLQLHFKARDTLTLQAEALHGEVDADSVYAESYAC